MQERLKVSIPSIRRLTEFLKSKGFFVSSTGQENWLTPELHEQIRYIHGDNTVDLIRYFPDFVVYRNRNCFFVQAKATTPEYYDGKNFSIETACLTIDKKLASIGIRVLVIFENRPNEFYGAWANEIEPFFETDKTASYKGSKTPMSLVAKSSISELERILLGKAQDNLR